LDDVSTKRRMTLQRMNRHVEEKTYQEARGRQTESKKRRKKGEKVSRGAFGIKKEGKGASELRKSVGHTTWSTGGEWVGSKKLTKVGKGGVLIARLREKTAGTPDRRGRSGGGSRGKRGGNAHWTKRRLVFTSIKEGLNQRFK